MKNLFLLLIVIFINFPAAAQKYIARAGHIGFFSKGAVEDIEAHNYQASGILNTEAGEVAFSVLMKGFEFEKALMQEHFNENYVESDKYPKATFKGSIVDFKSVELKDGSPAKVKVEGELTLHGVTKKISVDGELMKQENKITAKSTFPVKLADYNIKIPKAVIDNIAEVVDVTVDFPLEPYVQ